MSDMQNTQVDEGTAAQLEKLVEQLGQDTEAWMPEPGEMLAGTITGVGVRSSEYGRYPALTVQQLDGTEVVFHAFRTVALNEVIRARPKVGDMIAVAYLGDPKKIGYHEYRIRFAGQAGAELDWDQFEEKSRDNK
jgi:hypothetical protein